MLVYQVLSFVVAALSSVLMMPWILRLCHKNGLYDTPNARKVHRSRIPRMGGVVFVPTVAMGLMAGFMVLIKGADFSDSVKVGTLLIGTGMLLIYLVGLLDDLFGLSANLKFVVQMMAAFVFPLSGLYFDNLYGIFGIYELNVWVGYAITVFLVVFVMNSINTIDGIDGLCAGISLIALMAYDYYFNEIHNYIFCLFIAAIIGTLFVFLWYNVFGNAQKGTKTFMGDSGSLTLGFILSYLGIKLSMADGRIAPPAEGILIPLSLLAIPTFDLVRVAVGRIMKGRHPFSPDKTHIHHLIMRVGLTQRQTLVLLFAADVAIFAANMFCWSTQININVILLGDILIYAATVGLLMKYAGEEDMLKSKTEIPATQDLTDERPKKYTCPNLLDTDIKISIIVATYNSGETLTDTFDSILRQTYRNYEVVLCDGCSKDNTMEIVREYESRFEGRLKAVSEPDAGIYDAMNKGIDRATGDVIGILNSDDFYTSDNVLERIAEAFKKVPLLEAVYGDVHYVKTENLNRTVRYYSSKSFHPAYMRMGFMPAHPSFYCLKELYSTYGKYRLDYKVAADFDQLFRLIYVHRIRAQYIDMDFVTMRTGGASNSGMKSHMQIIRDHSKSIRSYGIPVSYTLFGIRYSYKCFEVLSGRLGLKSR